MKRLIYSFFLMFIFCNYAIGSDGRIGIVDDINIAKKEITVKFESGKMLKMGETVEVITDTGKTLLVVRYPMLTVGICKIKGKGEIYTIQKNMPVYLAGEFHADNIASETEIKTDDRFIESADGFVKDNTTGLIWLKDADPSRKSMTWEEAKEFTAKLNAGGYNDWRLPTKEEIEYFIKTAPRELDTRFYNVRNFYWTSTLYPGSEGLVWVADVDHGTTDKKFAVNANYITNDNYIWPVRDGKGSVMKRVSSVKSASDVKSDVKKEEDPVEPEAIKVCNKYNKKYVSYQRDSSGIINTTFSITCGSGYKKANYKLNYNNLSGSWSEDDSEEDRANDKISAVSRTPGLMKVKDEDPVTSQAVSLCKKYNKKYVSYNKKQDDFTQLVCEVTCKNSKLKSTYKLVYDKFSGEWSEH